MRFWNFMDVIINHFYSKSWIKNFKRKGGVIGEKTVFVDLRKSKIDSTRPWLLEIGKYSVISSGVTILTHDYSLSTLRRVYGVWYGEGKVTKIGDNCFIGIDSIILMGTQIGNNVVVGAGSVVKGIIPDNVVVAGNPARVICSLEDYKNKRQERTIKEAKECAEQFYKRLKKTPTPSDLAGFKFLFCPRNQNKLKEYNLSFNCSADEPKEIEEAFFSSKPYWNDFEDFLKSCIFD